MDTITKARKSQAERLLNLLQVYAENTILSEGWVSLPRILELHIASHTKRIHELRRAGHIIEIKDEWNGRERHTAYRLVRSEEKGNYIDNSRK